MWKAGQNVIAIGAQIGGFYQFNGKVITKVTPYTITTKYHKAAINVIKIIRDSVELNKSFKGQKAFKLLVNKKQHT